MLAFYPYKKDGTKVNYDSTIVPEDFPDGRVEVPFIVDGDTFPDGGMLLKFLAGFLGAQQEILEDSDEVIVSPVIGWCVIDDQKDEAK